jgi:type IV pilus assembly protein PilA
MNIKINKIFKTKAFSLVELIVTVAVIGILSSIAIPMYDSYSVRAKLVESLSALDQLKQLSMDYYNQNGALPGAITDLTGVTADSYNSAIISKVNVTSAGVLQVFLGTIIPRASGQTDAVLNLVPTVSGNIVKWECGSLSISGNYLPSGCKTGVGPN